MAAYEEAQQADDGSYTTVTSYLHAYLCFHTGIHTQRMEVLASLAAGNWAGNQRNPIVYMGYESYQDKKYKVLSTMYAEIYPIENLTVRTQFGADFTHSTAFMQSFPSLSSTTDRVLRHAESSDVST